MISKLYPSPRERQFIGGIMRGQDATTYTMPRLGWLHVIHPI